MRRFLTVLAVVSLVLGGCSSDDDTTETPAAGTDGTDTTAGGGDTTTGDDDAELGDIVDVALANGSFGILAQALETAGLVDTLKGEGPFTVFAPTDAAFEAAFEALGITADELLAREDLAAILTYHVLGGSIASTDLEAVQVVSTVAELSAIVVSDENGVKVNGAATVSTADVPASNGVIHVVDAVILPASILELATAHPDFTTLGAAVAAVPAVAETLAGEGPFTLFAPTDAAFEAAIAALDTTADELLAREDLGDILTYHALGSQVLAADVTSGDVATVNGANIAITVADEGVTINEVNIVTTDIVGTNGVIHVIDGVLLPPANE